MIWGTFGDRLAAVVGRRSCWPKRQHLSRGDAVQHRQDVLSNGLAKNPKRIHVYRCPACRAWHVGHPGGRRVGKDRV